jgi:hypothetical protein
MTTMSTTDHSKVYKPITISTLDMQNQFDYNTGQGKVSKTIQMWQQVLLVPQKLILMAQKLIQVP